MFPQPDLPSLEVDAENAGSPTQHVPTELHTGGGGGETWRRVPSAEQRAQQQTATAVQYPHDRLLSAPARTPARSPAAGGSAAGSVCDSALGFGSGYTASSGFGGRFSSTGRGTTSPLTATTAFTHHPPLLPASLVSVGTSPLNGGWPLQWSQAATAKHQVVLTELVRLIRFPLTRKEYLSGTVERAQHVMAWPAMKDLLLAAYKYLLFPPADGAPGGVECHGRLQSPEFYI
ncbi:hypothetical protein H9P43_009347 [Blastocladiella emersonii ATCC 22665]|nr:hypothetical protein H9P43_009347 [Blastocladiella emersonii ATCC 22665]